MLKSRTHFEQVPLETVRRIVQEQIQQVTTSGEGIEKETVDKGFAGAGEASMPELANFLRGVIETIHESQQKKTQR